MDEIKTDLPYPSNISVNSLYKISNGVVYLSQSAKKYKFDVSFILKKFNALGNVPVELEIQMFPPDNRTRDIDNILKIVIDAIQFSKVIDNDKQIKRLFIQKEDKIKGGLLKIVLRPFVKN